jgi:hypothetical protein
VRAVRGGGGGTAASSGGGLVRAVAAVVRSSSDPSTYRRFRGGDRRWAMAAGGRWVGLEVAVVLDGARGKRSGGNDACT